MQFERQLSAEEIQEYLAKGSEKASQTFERAAGNVILLRRIYDAVLDTTDHTLENLSKEGYAHKNDIYPASGDKISEGRLRNLMLCAVEAVQCLEELEPHLERSGSKLLDPAVGLDRRIKLLKAITVFRTDGQSDIPAMDAEQEIREYRLNHPVLAAE